MVHLPNASYDLPEVVLTMKEHFVITTGHGCGIKQFSKYVDVIIQDVYTADYLTFLYFASKCDILMRYRGRVF